MIGTRKARLTLVAVTSAVGILASACVSVGVKDYEGFRSAVESGASCSELLDIKSGFEGTRDEARMDRDLRAIGCTSAGSSRTDR